MVGYVKRINDATLRVPIGGVRIGAAKYSRLAQINLKTHIITFSRYAIENVPERGRRYLVIHELAHVREASHNKRFWGLVGEHEPKYKEIGKELEIAFHKNVAGEKRKNRQSPEGRLRQGQLFPASFPDDWNSFADSLENPPLASEQEKQLLQDFPDYYELESAGGSLLTGRNIKQDPGLIYPLDSGRKLSENLFDCNDIELGSWEEIENGIIYGGSDLPDELQEDYFDHF